MKCGFKRTINWGKYQWKVSTQVKLTNQSAQGANRIFALSFEDNTIRARRTGYFFPKPEIKDFNVMIDGQNFFDQPVKNDIKTYDNIRKTATGQGDDYTSGCLLDYPYFKKMTNWMQ